MKADLEKQHEEHHEQMQQMELEAKFRQSETNAPHYFHERRKSTGFGLRGLARGDRFGDKILKVLWNQPLNKQFRLQIMKCKRYCCIPVRTNTSAWYRYWDTAGCLAHKIQQYNLYRIGEMQANLDFATSKAHLETGHRNQIPVPGTVPLLPVI